jgi:preprotein translocase subunit YajC
MLEEFLNTFVSPAYADPAAGAAQQGGGMSLIMMFVLALLFIYLAIWRPQSKRSKEQQTLMSSLAKGDEVMTAGGMLGKVSKISDQYVTIGIASDVEIVLQKTSVVSILPKGTLKSIE